MKKIVSLLIALAMLLAMAPATFAANLSDAPSGTATAGEDSKHVLTFTPESNGTLTVTVGDGTTNWSSDVMYFGPSFEILVAGSASGSAEATYTAELTAGVTYRLRFWETDGGALAATPYSTSFTEGGGSGGQVPSVTLETYALSEQTLSVGDNTVQLDSSAYTTVYVFSPGATGTYTVRAPEGVNLGYWGGTTAYIFDATQDKTNSLEVSLTDAGQSALIGVTNTDISSTTIVIERTGDAGMTVYEEVVYENVALGGKFTLPENAVVGDYVDVYGQTHTAVAGDDGYYHLDSADGAILLVDMDHLYVLTEVLNSERPVMYVTDTENLIRYDIKDAILAYEDACDANGYYPLTEDLIYFYTEYAGSAGIYSYCLEEGYNEACAWMFACITMTIPTEPDPTDPDPTDPDPTEPDPTEPDPTEPDPTEPDPTDPDPTEPDPTDPDPTDPDLTDPDPTDPDPTDPDPTDPDPTDPDPTDPDPTDPDPTDPDDPEFRVGELLLGDNRVELVADDNDGETWTFTASENGTLTIAVTQLENYDEYNGIWNDGTEYLSSLFYRQWYWLLVNEDCNSTQTYTLEVEAGEEVTIQLYTYYGYHTKATINLELVTEQDSTDPTDPDPTDPENTDPTEPDATEPTDPTEPDDSESDAQWEASWTAQEDGILTLTISGNPGWAYQYLFDGIWSVLHTGSLETQVAWELLAGETYTFAFWSYNASEWDFANGTLTYDLSFEAAQVEKEEIIEDYLISDQNLDVGTNPVLLEGAAYLTAFNFAPAETGTYTFTAPEGVELCHYGTAIYPYNATTASGLTMTNTLTITITAVGQSALIGVNNGDLALAHTTITVEKTAEYVEHVVELEVYENQQKPTDFELPQGAAVGEYVDVYGEDHTAVLGEDGYYHLDSADGPILLVDMDYLAVLTDALKEGRGIMYAYVVDDDGTILAKYDIAKAIKAYEKKTDENGYYPLTADLIFFYDIYAAGSGTYEFYLGEGYNPQCAWMFACVTMTVEEAGTPDGTITPTPPETADTSISLVAALLLISAMSIVALPQLKKHF